jgi:myo-inositol-1(or 4)-monophosphatase
MSTSFAAFGTACEEGAVEEFERVALAAADRAGALLRQRYGRRQQVSFKSEIDLVTAVDREAEVLIVDTIRQAFPDHGIMAEESPASAGRGEYRWYVDPLDGTTNFAHGFPQFAVSIALEHAGEVLVGVVHDPLREETFAATRGGGARLNGTPIGVSDVATLGHCLVGSGFPYDVRERVDFYEAFWREALTRAQGVRRVGSAALDLCFVACGRLDAFWEWNLHAWDVAAGCLIVEEAGGRVSDLGGGLHRLTGGQTAASNGQVHDELVHMLADVQARLASTGSGG